MKPGEQVTSDPEAEYTVDEMMMVSAARELAGKRTCFVGVGMPNTACNLAKCTVAPEIELIYESGVYAASGSRVPLSIGDPTLVTNAISVMSMFDLFSSYLQGGLIDVGFLGASQIDRHGNINTTVIGDYRQPRVRLPGSGGACEIAIHAREVFVILRQTPRSFVDKVDFITSPGRGGAGQGSGGGISGVITDLAVYTLNESGEMSSASLHPGVSVESVRAKVGWEIRIPGDVPTTSAPTDHELHILRRLLATSPFVSPGM